MMMKYNRRVSRTSGLLKEHLEKLNARIFARFLGLYSSYLNHRIDFTDFDANQAILVLQDQSNQHNLRTVLSDIVLILDLYEHGDRFLVRSLSSTEYQLDMFEQEIVELSYLDFVFKLFIEQKHSFKKAVLALNLRGSSNVSRYFAYKPTPSKKRTETEVKMAFIQEFVHSGLRSIEVFDTNSKIDIEVSHQVGSEQIYESILVDKINSVISIRSRIESRRSTYLDLCSRLFFEDSEYYTSNFRVTANPIVESTSGSISTSGFIGFKNIQVRKLVFKSINEPYEQFVLKDKNNLLDHVGDHIINYLMNWHSIVEFELAFHFRDRKRPVIVNCRLPNNLRYDRRRYNEQVLAFLINRGFVVLDDRADIAIGCSI